MRELYNDMDDKSREAAAKLRIAFDENAWNTMEMMLDEHDRIPVPLPDSTISTAVIGSNQNYKWIVLVMLFFTIGGLLVTKHNSTQN